MYNIETMLKEAIVVYFTVLSQQLPRGCKNKEGKLHVVKK